MHQLSIVEGGSDAVQNSEDRIWVEEPSSLWHCCKKLAPKQIWTHSATECSTYYSLLINDLMHLIWYRQFGGCQISVFMIDRKKLKFSCHLSSCAVHPYNADFLIFEWTVRAYIHSARLRRVNILGFWPTEKHRAFIEHLLHSEYSGIQWGQQIARCSTKSRSRVLENIMWLFTGVLNTICSFRIQIRNLNRVFAHPYVCWQIFASKKNKNGKRTMTKIVLRICFLFSYFCFGFFCWSCNVHNTASTTNEKRHQKPTKINFCWKWISARTWSKN